MQWEVRGLAEVNDVVRMTFLTWETFSEDMIETRELA